MQSFAEDETFCIEFPANVADVTVSFNKRMKAQHVFITAVSFRGATAGGPVMYLKFDEMSMNCASTNVPGYPIPVVETVATASGGSIFPSALHVAIPSRSAIKDLRAVIVDGANAPYAHTGVIAIWVRTSAWRHHESPAVREALQYSRRQDIMSGLSYDTRRDDTPTLRDQAHGLSIKGYSIDNPNK